MKKIIEIFTFWARSHEMIKAEWMKKCMKIIKSVQRKKKVVESLMTEQSTFKHVIKRARSSENRNAVSIEISCRMLNNSQENCLKLRNEQEMQSQIHCLKWQFSLWSSQSALTSSQQYKIKWKWCFKLTFHHLQRFSCWT